MITIVVKTEIWNSVLAVAIAYWLFFKGKFLYPSAVGCPQAALQAADSLGKKTLRNIKTALAAVLAAYKTKSDGLYHRLLRK